MKKIELAKQKLKNLNYEIILIEKDRNFHNWITFKTDKGFKLKCDIYNILKDDFKIDAYLLVWCAIIIAFSALYLFSPINK